MIPNFQILGKPFSAYMIMALIGVLTMLFTIKRIAKRSGVDELQVQNMLLVSFIGVVIGSHLLCGIGNYKRLIYVLKNIEYITTFKAFADEMIIIFGGSVFYGGLIGAMIASIIYLKAKKLNIGLYTDLGAMAVPLFHTFGRIGCFLSGCCYGIESRFGFIYHNSIVESANGVRRFPVQLVEALFNLCLFFAIYYLYKNKKLCGKLFAIYLLSYSFARFCLEFLRGDDYRGFIGKISSLQLLSIIIFVSALLFLIIKTTDKRRIKAIEGD